MVFAGYLIVDRKQTVSSGELLEDSVYSRMGHTESDAKFVLKSIFFE